jgi:hypothetical protein
LNANKLKKEMFREMGGKKKEGKEKPLDKMTSKELREMAMKIPEISGVHGMNKTELIGQIKLSRGITDEAPRAKGDSARVLKEKIRKLKSVRESALKSEDEKMAAIYRKRIIRLKKKTRRVAA